MKTLNFFEKIISSPIRNKRKSKVIKQVIDKPQENKDITNLHRIDRNNVGDYYSAPYHYYHGLGNTVVDLFDYKSSEQSVTDEWVEKISANKLVIGGGGLLNRKSFERQMNLFQSLAEDGKKIVLWGIGHNSKNKNEFQNISEYNIKINQFDLYGTRDASMTNNYLPCVSCKHPIFDTNFKPINETGIIFHKNTVKSENLINQFGHIPHTSNTTNLEEIISFIGNCETIITDSYHGMYWSMLLEKKVAVVPNSSKFFDFKYKPVITTFEECLKDARNANSYSGLLEECRKLNDDFYNKAANYLNL